MYVNLFFNKYFKKEFWYIDYCFLMGVYIYGMVKKRRFKLYYFNLLVELMGIFLFLCIICGYLLILY